MDQAKRIEHQTGKTFTFLTVTNAGASRINAAGVQSDFPAAWSKLGEEGAPGDFQAGGCMMVFAKGMCIRPTQNVDKDRGFVNGALGKVKEVLHQSVSIMETDDGVLILVRPVHRRTSDQGTGATSFMPCTYGYAMTMRRAQGSTLDGPGLYFDRKCPDRGYSYVGASRARRQGGVHHVGHLRRTDWLPVGGDPAGDEQTWPGPMGKSDNEDEIDDDYSESSGGESFEQDAGVDTLAANLMGDGNSEESGSSDAGSNCEFGTLCADNGFDEADFGGLFL